MRLICRIVFSGIRVVIGCYRVQEEHQPIEIVAIVPHRRVKWDANSALSMENVMRIERL